MTGDDVDIDDSLAAIQNRDEAAGRALVERLHPLVARIVRRHLPVRTDEEDLVQSVFLKIFDRLETYRPRAGVPFEHWVSRVAVRTCLDALRSERRRPEWRWSDLPEDQAAGLEFLLSAHAEPPPLTDASARELLERLLGQLRPPDRLVIQLLDLEEKTVADIAALTGWSRTGVKVRAFRARRRLRKLAQALGTQERHE